MVNTNHIPIIAEAGVNHDGDVEKALDLIRMSADCGADIVKFQVFKAELNVTKSSKLASYQEKSGIDDANQLEMLQKYELSESDFEKLKLECDKLNLEFLATPDDTWSIQLLVNLECRQIKVASAEVDNFPLLLEIGATGKEIILSTGMSTLDEVKAAVTTLLGAGAQSVKLMHCTSNYPTLPQDANLLAIRTLLDETELEVGFSDHTLGHQAALIAIGLGATFIEKHITLDKNLSGPDHQASADPAEFKFYVEQIRSAEVMLGSGVKSPMDSEQAMLPALRRSLVAATDLTSGTELKANLLMAKRPGSGISPSLINDVIGRKLKNSISKDSLLSFSDLD